MAEQSAAINSDVPPRILYSSSKIKIIKHKPGTICDVPIFEHIDISARLTYEQDGMLISMCSNKLAQIIPILRFNIEIEPPLQSTFQSKPAEINQSFNINGTDTIRIPYENINSLTVRDEMALPVFWTRWWAFVPY